MGNLDSDLGQPPRPMHQAAYARRLGVNPSTVNRWIKAGRISLRPDGLIDPVQADRERLATESPLPQHQSLKARWDAEREAKAAAADAPRHPTGGFDAMPGIEKLGAALKLETYKLQKAKAEQANMELDRMAGTLVERAQVDLVLADFGATLRSMMQSLPYRVAPTIAAHRGDVNAIHAELESLAKDLLEEISAHMIRKLEAMQ